MNEERAFVDTNVLVYAHDDDEAGKQAIAAALLEDLWLTRRGVVSTQVLEEFYWTVTRKLRRPVTRQDARTIVRDYADWSVHLITADDIVAAAELEERESLPFWDALIVVSAARTRATIIYSEDFQAGRRIWGIAIKNPFAS